MFKIFKRNKKQKTLEKEKVEDFIEGIKRLSEKRIEEVMTPRIDMVCIKHNATLKEALEVFRKHPYSRIPVIKEDKDEVIGILFFKELLLIDFNEYETKKVTEIMKVPFYFTENKNSLEALKEMRNNKIHFALVVDEFGSVTGFVTLEDLVEEIVGDIASEFDREPIEKPQKTKDGYIIPGRISIEELSNLIELEKEDEEEVVTAAGYIIKKIKRIPSKGEKIQIGKYIFEILDASESRIKKIKISKVK
ncbi:MAG: hemolysin family protein [Candidatus Hydrothermales bacterium]